MAIIDISGLSYTYPDSEDTALDNLSLDIGQGQFVAVIGANNSGKTSLCHALTGVIPHLYQGSIRGHVRVCDKDSAETSVSEMAESVALVMQNPESQLSGVRFTVRDEIAFGLENRGMDRQSMLDRVDAALALTGLADLADRSPHHLSGGQMQKVALAAAVAGDTPILVLDEPTTFLDPASARAVFAILRQLGEQGKTIVVAEQRLESVALFADRVIALHKGQAVLDGAPEEVLVSPRIRDIGLDWTRFTRIGELAGERDLWPEDAGLPTTLEDTVQGLGNG
ncbi:energy-coupling factor ABC transporter ATP-binding protein [Pseudodesulfovibrio portus]|uniref:ABC transporter ATP-binding protein n=1 Tax=Pseudodesulfovibrio portus TaxID=231439 RepID=A0ABM8AW77_9BACT|nr:ABC transporter ATP-binding protein [Pseudodesulfovibrio portus]BDQ35516.1 ABC transporter ATP-binding protein [Pseudodesulfovibrio portus]